MKMLLLEYCQDDPRLPAGNKKGWTGLLVLSDFEHFRKADMNLASPSSKLFLILRSSCKHKFSSTISRVLGAGICRQKTLMLWFCRMRCREMCFSGNCSIATLYRPMWSAGDRGSIDSEVKSHLENTTKLHGVSSALLQQIGTLWVIPITCRRKRTVDQNTASGSPSMECNSQVLLWAVKSSVVWTFTNCRTQRRQPFLSRSQRCVWCNSAVPLISGEPNSLVLHQEI